MLLVSAPTFSNQKDVLDLYIAAESVVVTYRMIVFNETIMGSALKADYVINKNCKEYEAKTSKKHPKYNRKLCYLHGLTSAAHYACKEPIMKHNPETRSTCIEWEKQEEEWAMLIFNVATIIKNKKLIKLNNNKEKK